MDFFKELLFLSRLLNIHSDSPVLLILLTMVKALCKTNYIYSDISLYPVQSHLL